MIIIPSDPINIGNTVDSQLPAEACSCHGNISKFYRTHAFSSRSRKDNSFNDNDSED